MTEPNTPNRGLIVPNTGDLVGAWGTAAMNPNFSAIDGMLGGFATLSFSSATTITLSISTAVTLTPGAGPTQSQNALLYFTGTLAANSIVQFQMPGFYIVHNQCTVGSYYIQLAPATGSGTAIGAPPGRKAWVFFDGTNVDYVNPLDPGTRYDLMGVTSIPAWMNACTVAPYLLRNGAVYSTSTYPALGAYLGSTFGGNGITTFGVPDSLARVDVAFDTSGTGRLTSGGSGVNGQTMGSAGGNQSMQAHSHGASVSDPGHFHAIPTSNVSGPVRGGTEVQNSGNLDTTTALTGISVSIGTTGSGGSQNVQPTIISYLPLIKT